MTLDISLITRKYCISASDTRLTSGGRIVEDQLDKSISVFAGDARVTLTFSGIAEFGSFKTHRYLLDTLPKIAAPDYSINSIVQRLTENITKTFTDRPAISQQRLSILLCGFTYDINQKPYPVYAMISNWHNPVRRIDREPNSKFELFRSGLSDEKNCEIVFIGTSYGIDPLLFNELKSMAHLLTPRSAERKLVYIIQKASKDWRSGGTIGGKVFTHTVLADLSKGIETSYSTDEVQRATYLPSVVWAQPGAVAAVTGAKVEPVEASTPPMSVPRVGRNKPCPCGSGKKYKHCHDRKTPGKSDRKFALHMQPDPVVSDGLTNTSTPT